MSLRKEAAKATPWVIIERFGEQIIQFAILIVLGRLLSPSEFGLVAMLTVVIAICRITIDSGMGQALIRKKSISIEDKRTVFTFNLIVSCILYLVFYFSVPWIAEFYNTPELVLLGRVLGISFILFSLTIVQRAELTQRHKFKEQAYAKLPAILLAGIISIILARNQFGAWALVAQSLLYLFFNSIGLWIINPLPIKLKIYSQSFKDLFGFSNRLLLSGFIVVTFKESYKLIIGKFYSSTDLGFYVQAKKIQEVISQQIVSIIRKISYPLMAKVQDDEKRLKKGYRSILLLTSNIIFPIVIFTYFEADLIIQVLLGDKWLGAIPFLKILCFSGAIIHVNDINLNLLKVLGKSKLVLRIAIIRYTIISISIIVGLKFGLKGLLIAQVISGYINLFFNTYYTRRLINYSLFSQLKDLLKTFIGLTPIVFALILLRNLIQLNNLLELTISLLTSITIYFLLIRFIPSKINTELNSIFKENVQILFKR